MKLTKANTAKRFRWSRYFPGDKDGDPAIRLTCSGDGERVKVTRCRDLTPEELADAAKWFIGVSKDLKRLRESGWAGEKTKPKQKRKAA